MPVMAVTSAAVLTRHLLAHRSYSHAGNRGMQLAKFRYRGKGCAPQGCRKYGSLRPGFWGIRRYLMLPEKRMLSLEEIDAQTVMELPDRELMQCSALVGCFTVNLLNGATINVPINAAANICGVSVAALLAAIAGGATSCNAHAGTV